MGGKILFLFIVFAVSQYRRTAIVVSQSVDGPKHGKKVVCYLGLWSFYQKEPLQFQANDFDPSLCTHLVYSFAMLDEKTHNIYSKYKDLDINRSDGETGYKEFVALKKQHPHLKVTLSIGGWNEGSVKFSKMAADSEARRQFVKSVIKYLQTHEFDGLDIMWLYPTTRGGVDEDKENFVTLVKELKEAFREHNYLLTAALRIDKDFMKSAYDLAQLNQHLDLIHIMAYEYNQPWYPIVGANAPLNGTSAQDTKSVDYTIRYMIASGVSPEKMVLGLPFYGRTFLLTDPHVNPVTLGRTLAKGIGFPGPILQENNFYGYHELCLELKNKSIPWEYHWDKESSTPYIRDRGRLISYDNPRSIANKVKLAIDYNLDGFMVWRLDDDDFKGLCDIRNDTYKDFEERFDSISKDPVFQDTVDFILSISIDPPKEDNFYVIESSKLKFNVPKQNFHNYQLMRTINQATYLALEEMKMLKAFRKIKAIVKDEEIKNNLKPNISETCVASSCLNSCIQTCLQNSFFINIISFTNECLN